MQMTDENMIDTLGLDFELLEPELGPLTAVDQKRHLHHREQLRRLMSMMRSYGGIGAQYL